MKTDTQMSAVQRGKVRGQPEMRAQQFTCDLITMPSFGNIGPVVTEEFSGNLCGGDGGVRLKT